MLEKLAKWWNGERNLSSLPPTKLEIPPPLPPVVEYNCMIISSEGKAPLWAVPWLRLIAATFGRTGRVNPMERADEVLGSLIAAGWIPPNVDAKAFKEQNDLLTYKDEE